MSRDLRRSYNRIADSYLGKKQEPWSDFVRFFTELDWKDVDSVVDIGGGNGRNLNAVEAGHHVVLDLAIDLLRGYVGPEHGGRVAGALPHLPFRKDSFSHGLVIAVIHHLSDPEMVIQSLQCIENITSQRTVLSVWRRWRKDYRDKLLKAINRGEDLNPLINHERPWKSSKGQVIAHRFYHYYTYKELYEQIQNTDYSIEHVRYMGGRYDDANIFIELA